MAVQPAEGAEPGTGGDLLYTGGTKAGGVGFYVAFYIILYFTILLYSL